jgi:hypothetical protein
MTNPENNSASGDSITRPTFGYILNLLVFMFNCYLTMSMFVFNSCLNMSTCTCIVSLTVIILWKYLFNIELKYTE